MKKYSSATVWVIAIFLLILSATFLLNGSNTADKIVFSDFQQKWINDEIKSIVVDPDKMMITGKTTEDVRNENQEPEKEPRKFEDLFDEKGMIK